MKKSSAQVSAAEAKAEQATKSNLTSYRITKDPEQLQAQVIQAIVAGVSIRSTVNRLD